MSDSSTPTPAPTAETTPKKGYHPLAILAGLGTIAIIAITAFAVYNHDGVASAESTPSATPAEAAKATDDKGTAEEIPASENPLTLVAATLTGPVTISANADTVLAPVTIRRQDHLCAVVVVGRQQIENVGNDDLRWSKKSSKERFELCGRDLRKESDGALTVGGKRVKLSELIATRGGEEYTSLTSTPGALARCWGNGQINADGEPACTALPEVVAQNAAK